MTLIRKSRASPVIDPLVSLIVAGFIIHAGYEIFRENSDVLLDSVAINAAEISELVMAFPDVKVSIISGAGAALMTSILTYTLRLTRAGCKRTHQLAHDIEDAIMEKYHRNSEVIIHIEPYKEDAGMGKIKGP